MKQLSKVILAYSRACEHLLSTESTLNDDESSLVEYYVKEVSRKFVSAELTEQKRLHNNNIQARPAREVSRPGYRPAPEATTPQGPTPTNSSGDF